MRRAFFAVLLAGLTPAISARAEVVHVAVAANFTSAAEELAPLFKAETGHDVLYSFGSTGQLYNQISQGAPFDVFLSADDLRPEQAVREGLGIDGSVFTYAVGALVLYSASFELSDGRQVLAGGAFDKLAIADPATAPYGRAAREVITALGLSATLTPKFVTGENITQTLQFIETGNAELGFVAASQVMGKTGIWRVPTELYSPIRQDAVLLMTGEDNEAAAAFMAFLRSDATEAVIRGAGYDVD
jgi:molybdate transport system substrate-binding protein